MDGIVLDQIYNGFTLINNVIIYHESYTCSLRTEKTFEFVAEKKHLNLSSSIKYNYYLNMTNFIF